MRYFGNLIPYEDALRIVLDNITPLSRTEEISLGNSLGRVLAQDIVATFNTPPFDRASMDGFAVVAQDTASASSASPVRLELDETVFAGTLPTKTVTTGRCVQIATGARMPPGADAVIMAEDTRKNSEELFVIKPVQKGVNIGRLGNDIMRGATLIRAGTVLTAAHIGVMASQGLTCTIVYAQPVVAILPTGEEIVPPGAALGEGQIYDINSHTLAAMVRLHGGEPWLLPVAGDQPGELHDALDRTLAADLVLTSGGSSVGEKDLLLGILEERGRVLFRGVKIKPSKPTTFSEIGGKPILGVPGNPTSCLMTAHLFLVPALRRLAHLSAFKTHTTTAILADGVAENERRQFITVKVAEGVASSVFKESSAITSMSEALGYVAVPENTAIAKGATVEVILF
ncbi:MAG: molybdopterin molybdotransferase MoeA [Dehalococcoidia bacterium]|nr:molybdopterin molybdotransferase MoeA [Dehalococcoidia bacterium]